MYSFPLRCAGGCVHEMKRTQRPDLGRKGLLVVCLLLAGASEVRAYADPGTGAFLWQALMAGCFGALFYVRRFMTWLRAGRKREKNASAGDQ